MEERPCIQSRDNMAKKRQTVCDIEYLIVCYNSNIVPEFLGIKVYKRCFQCINHVTYKGNY